MDLLDEYLNEDSSLTDMKLSGEEFDSQLLGSAATEPAPAGGLDVQSLLAQAFKNAGKQMEREDEVRDGIKMASHGVRVLGTLYSSIIKNVDYNDGEKVSQQMRSALAVVREDSYKITRACGLVDDEVPAWLHSQVSGQVMEIVTAAIDRDNGSLERANKSQYLQPLIEALTKDGAKGISATFYANPNDPELQIINALMMATASVMAEYQAFTYFNSDPKTVARQVTEILKSRVIDETLTDLTCEWNMTAQERAYIGSSLLSHAGKLMASSWSNNVLATLEYVKTLDDSERKAVLVSGYPLDIVFDDFENFYGGLEVSAQASLEMLRQPSVGKSNDLVASKRESPSPRMQ